MTRKMERDIKNERTFTSFSDKLYFLCELSWEMLASNRMKLNYRDFPSKLTKMFTHRVKDGEALDHWRYDMMGQTMLIRDAVGNYSPAHRSLLEFFVAYKLAAELGVLAEDFARTTIIDCETVGSNRQPQIRTWSQFFLRERDSVKEQSLLAFAPEPLDILQKHWGGEPWSKAVLDLLVPMISREKTAITQLQRLLLETRNKSKEGLMFFAGNLATLLVLVDRLGLAGLDLSTTVLNSANLVGA